MLLGPPAPGAGPGERRGPPGWEAGTALGVWTQEGLAGPGASGGAAPWGAPPAPARGGPGAAGPPAGAPAGLEPPELRVTAPAYVPAARSRPMSIDLGSVSIKHALDNIQFSPSAGVVTPSPSNKALAPWQERESILSESSSDETTVLHLAPFLDKQHEKDTGSSRSTANGGGGPGSAAAPAKPMNSRQRRTERRKRERENKARLDAGLPPLPELGR